MEVVLQRGTVVERHAGGHFPLGVVTSLLDTLESSLLIAELSGKLLFANLRARQCLNARGLPDPTRLNLFGELLQIDPNVIFGQIESGEHEVDLQVACPEGKVRARIRWLPEPDRKSTRLNS